MKQRWTPYAPCLPLNFSSLLSLSWLLLHFSVISVIFHLILLWVLFIFHTLMWYYSSRHKSYISNNRIEFSSFEDYHVALRAEKCRGSKGVHSAFDLMQLLINKILRQPFFSILTTGGIKSSKSFYLALNVNKVFSFRKSHLVGHKASCSW